MAESKSSILLVDDDADDLSALTKALDSLGCEITSVTDPHEVLPAVYRELPDVVVLDALLPGLSGFDLCKQIKTDGELKGTQVIIITGVYLRQQYRQEALQQFKADGFLTKPFRAPELLRLVVELLAKKTRTPQSGFLSRLGLPASSPSPKKKRGLLGRLFGKEEPEPTRIAPAPRPRPGPLAKSKHGQVPEPEPSSPSDPEPEQAPARKPGSPIELGAAAVPSAEDPDPVSESEPAQGTAEAADASAVDDASPEVDAKQAPETPPEAREEDEEESVDASESPSDAMTEVDDEPAASEQKDTAPVEPEPVAAKGPEPEAEPDASSAVADASAAVESSKTETAPDAEVAAEADKADDADKTDDAAKAEDAEVADRVDEPDEADEPNELEEPSAPDVPAEAAPKEQAVQDETPDPQPTRKEDTSSESANASKETDAGDDSKGVSAAPAAAKSVPALAEAPASESENDVDWTAQSPPPPREPASPPEPAPAVESNDEEKAAEPETSSDVASGRTEDQAKEMPAGVSIRRPWFRVGEVPLYDEEDFHLEFKRELSKCRRVDRPLTLILIHVDDLTQIVELFGKEVRQAVLWHVAEQAMASLREVDLVGLMKSKDLIALIAFASDKYGGGRVVARMRKSLKKRPFPVGEELPPIVPSLHFGMASFPDDGDDVVGLIAKAYEDIDR